MEQEGVDHETVTDLAHPAPTLSPAVLRRMKRTCNSSGGGISSEEAQDRFLQFSRLAEAMAEALAGEARSEEELQATFTNPT